MQVRKSYSLGQIVTHLSIWILFIAPSSSQAEQWQSSEKITSTIEQFVTQKTADSPNELQIKVTPPDSRLHLPKCEQPEVWIPGKNKLWGRTSVGVKCRNPAWSIYVPVTITVNGKALVSTHPIERGKTLEADDIRLIKRDITDYSNGVFTEPSQVIGKNTLSSIALGDVIRPELLRAPIAIKQGQTVTVVAQRENFKVSSEGVAQGNANIGQVVQVKVKSGQLIKGIAKGNGVVEVAF